MQLSQMKHRLVTGSDKLKMIRIGLQVFVDLQVTRICHTMVVADPGRIDAVESVPVRFPEFFETCIAKRAQQTLLQVIRLIVAGVDIEIGRNNASYLHIRAPVIRLAKRFQLSMVGVENLEPATAK